MAAICSLRIVCAARAPRVAAADSPETVPEPPKAAASPIKAPEAPKLRAGQKYKNLAEAVDAGLLQVRLPSSFPTRAVHTGALLLDIAPQWSGVLRGTVMCANSPRSRDRL